MARLLIEGRYPLQGRLEASGAKNAALPIIAACLLTREQVVLDRVPTIADVWVMADILREMGVQVEFNGNGTMVLDASDLATTTPPEDLVRRMNASFDVAGPLLAHHGEAQVSLPGGCKLGPRPVNLHLDAFRRLGAQVTSEHGFVKAKASRLRGAHILFPKVTVGATKNAMMAATLAEGVTVLENCAQEPEIVDLANFLVKMGARIEGQGSPKIRIEGVQELHGARHAIISDRIEGGTYLLAAAVTQGDITLEEFEPWLVESLLENLTKAGQKVTVLGNTIRVRGTHPIRPLEIATAPFPGFPTDLHPPIVAMLALADGTSVLQETIFEGRFMYAMEMVRLGADLRVSDRNVVIRGVPRLTAAPVDAPDIRAGGALVLAGLAAEGETVISGVEYIDRGYQNLEDRLRHLGARVRRVEEPLKQIVG
ncbi:MAG: UDP-N-acetylglucosamine 1-carboxyvinyltransferase [Burkholderiales bacterium]|nr:UDP-N-acetylglucosamine 1-carboxyvinyltransferase [Burkholderiales bacterium]